MQNPANEAWGTRISPREQYRLPTTNEGLLRLLRCSLRKSSVRCLLLRVIKRNVIQLSIALDAEDYRIPGLQPGQQFAQGFQRIERRAIQKMQYVAGLQAKERGVASSGQRSHQDSSRTARRR